MTRAGSPSAPPSNGHLLRSGFALEGSSPKGQLRGRPLILLKARPTPIQLADRLEPPVPDGMELYVHEQDVSGPTWFEDLAARFAGVPVPPEFCWIVEGPVWSLDGELFGLARGAEADRELTRRVVRLAAHIGARAVNIHCVEGTPDVRVLSESARAATLARALPFLEWYVGLCQEAGLLPLIENVPPICRMRRAAFIYTPIGVEPRDLVACVEQVSGLGITLDTSHAQLAVNASRPSAAPEAQDDNVRNATAYYCALGGPSTLEGYVDAVLPWVTSVHVSNAAGLLAEGLPYEQGDADLDAVVRRLAANAAYFVTEPIDPDDDHAILKRQMQAHLETALAPWRTAAGGPPGKMRAKVRRRRRTVDLD